MLQNFRLTMPPSMPTPGVALSPTMVANLPPFCLSAPCAASRCECGAVQSGRLVESHLRRLPALYAADAVEDEIEVETCEGEGKRIGERGGREKGQREGDPHSRPL